MKQHYDVIVAGGGFAGVGAAVAAARQGVSVLLVEKNGYSIVRELVGHGIGKQLHEDPMVPNFGKAGSGPRLNENSVIAIEPMVNMGDRNVVFHSDGWTCKTRDGLPSAHYENTVLITDDGVEILTL